MSDTPQQNSTVITRVSSPRVPEGHATMSYTAVTTHPEMAHAFANQLLYLAGQLIPDKRLTLEDLIAICRIALPQAEHPLQILEGRHLRGRISEQLSRARRYGEPFSILVLKWDTTPSRDLHESVIDTLCERMRQTDIIFTFKRRLILMLPHTEEQASILLLTRIRNLLAAIQPPNALSAIERLSFPCPSITKASQVLDWAEEQLR
ncbi:MAG: hypothetical protein GX146_08985 [Myxococcales bacterium]|nr:hypothetical protein [Myxococcales bacterium]